MSGLWTVQTLLPALVGVPLIAALTTALLRDYRWLAWSSVLFAVLQAILALALLAWLSGSSSGLEALDSSRRRYAFAGWGAPLGIDLYVDGFAALMIAVTALLGLALSIYSTAYFSDPAKAARFWPLWWLLMTGLNALFLAADAFNIYVTLEIIGLAAVALVALEGSRAALVAALRYLFVGLLGSLFYLLGVALLYRAYGTLDLAQLAAAVEPTALSWSALTLVTAGLLLKTALLPLHFWLPPAHASAPAPVSAALSALVVKGSFYLLARFWLDTLAPAATDNGLQLLGALGAAAVIWGSLQALLAHRLKLMVAYSTVAQLGYLFLLFPLSANSAAATGLSGPAVNAVAYFIVAHACAKAAMFLAAGNIMRAAGHDQIDRLHGLAGQQPLSLFTFAIAGASLIGLPPSAGFIAKWLLLNVAIDAAQWWLVLVVLTGGLMAATYIFRVLNLAFVAADSESPVTPAATTMRKLPATLPLCGFALALVAIILGFNAEALLELLAVGTEPAAAALAPGVAL